ncbi:hypothetical protein ES703_64518 [subsurface metagenome]
MKKVTIKNCILTYAQLPVALICLAAAYIQLAATWCLAYLSNPLSPPFAKLGGESHTDDRATERNSQSNIYERIKQDSLLNRN